jgi:hypothetical protein
LRLKRQPQLVRDVTKLGISEVDPKNWAP